MINHRKNGLSSKSVEDFTFFLHKECSKIDNGPSEKLLKNEFLPIFHFSKDFDNSVLQEIQIVRILSWFLQNFIFLVFLDLKVVHNIMECFLSNILEIFNLLDAFHDKLFHSIVVFINELHQMTL